MTRDSHHTVRLDVDCSSSAAFLSYLRSSIVGQSWYSNEYFNWKISTNPYQDSASYLRVCADRAAAHCSIVSKPPNPIACGTSRLAELGDTHTHPEFQKQGHFASLGRYVIDDYSSRAECRGALIYGLPNEAALPGWTRSIGCRQLDHLRIDEMRWLPSRGLPSLMSAYLQRQSHHLVPTSDAVSVADQIWPLIERRGSLVRKDGEWWRWRYATSVDSYQTYILASRKDGETAGWLVLRELPTRVLGVRRIAVCDIVTRGDDTDLAAISLVLRLAWPLRVVSIWWDCDGSQRGRLEAMGFRHHRPVPVIFADNEAFRELFRNRTPLRLSMGDSDVI